MFKLSLFSPTTWLVCLLVCCSRKKSHFYKCSWVFLYTVTVSCLGKFCKKKNFELLFWFSKKLYFEMYYSIISFYIYIYSYFSIWPICGYLNPGAGSIDRLDIFLQTWENLKSKKIDGETILGLVGGAKEKIMWGGDTREIEAPPARHYRSPT